MKTERRSQRLTAISWAAWLATAMISAPSASWAGKGADAREFTMANQAPACLPQAGAAGVIRVATNGNDSLSGTSWAEAKRTVNGALAVATASDEIWIARGTYAERIAVGDGRALYGGFSGTETSREQRQWKANFSTLYGSFGGVVVLITNAGPSTRLDGLVISGGQAIHGGGIKVVGSGSVIANSTIRNNITDGAGAGISVWGFLLLSSTQAYFPIITNNVLVENQSINNEGDGAGIGVIGSSPVITWNVIARNTATRNGGGSNRFYRVRTRLAP